MPKKPTEVNILSETDVEIIISNIVQEIKGANLSKSEMAQMLLELADALRASAVQLASEEDPEVTVH